MTPPASLVVSLENAKHLKGAGWPQDSSTEFFWIDNAVEWEREKGIHDWWCELVDWYDEKSAYYPQNAQGQKNMLETEHYAAPTAEEILRKLPRCMIECWEVDTDHMRFTVSIGKPFTNEGITSHFEEDDTLADAAASMYVFLAAHKLLP